MTNGTEPAAPVLRDGRYEGDGDGDRHVELRVDTAHGVISGDVFQVRGDQREHLASVRTDPGLKVLAADGSWPAFWQSHDGATTRGEIAVDPVPGDDAATVALRLDPPLNGLPGGVPLTAVVRRAGAELRRLGVEMETEQGVRVPAEARLNGTPVSFAECMRLAGFAVEPVGRPSAIPPQDGDVRWTESDIFGVMNDLMTANAQATLGAGAWQVHLLMLSRSAVKGLYGVMFDVTGTLPRQGCAVFVDEIRAGAPEPEQDRRILQTTVHEVGHALNLVHRFERTLGRADSLSFMNYDWQYLGGDRAADYWQRFDGRFDPDELLFLQHGPRSSVMPGTAPFHSVDYWGAAPGTFPALVPSAPTPGFALRLEPPPGGPLFDYGQPIFLTVSLSNTGSVPVALPPAVLDIKAGFLEVLVDRDATPAAPAGPSAGGQSFTPVVQRCIDLTPGPRPLDPGQAWRDNVSLTFGSGGFTMAEPGNYRLTPLITVTGRDGNPALVIRGETLTVRVGYPRTRQDEEHAMQLFQPKVGAWFALGGSDALGDAHDVVREIRQTRTAKVGESDPIAAAITRTLAIHASRSYTRWDGGRFVTRPADPTLASALLGELVTNRAAMAGFDRTTAASTRKMAEDLWSRR